MASSASLPVLAGKKQHQLVCFEVEAVERLVDWWNSLRQRCWLVEGYWNVVVQAMLAVLRIAATVEEEQQEVDYLPKPPATKPSSIVQGPQVLARVLTLAPHWELVPLPLRSAQFF